MASPFRRIDNDNTDYSTSQDTLPDLGKDFIQVHENEVAKVIFLHEPQIESWIGALHPNGSLFEDSIDIKKAQAEHRTLIDSFKREGIQVVRVVDIIKKECVTNVAERLKIEQLAMKCMKYQLEASQDRNLLDEKDKYLLSDEYKEKVISEMNVDQVVNVILSNPTVELKKADMNTELTTSKVSFRPLSNLLYCRDQQITTSKGIIMGRLNSETREDEVNLTKWCFNKLGMKVVGEIPSSGRLEGGDFFPMGQDLCMIGVGVRTNMTAVWHCMDNDLFGTKRVAVVKDCFDWDQQRMHLDTIFNVITNDWCVLLEDVVGQQSLIRRYVDIYRKDSSGKYQLIHQDIEFYEYLTEHLKFNVLKMTQRDQAHYGINFLNIGNGKIITPDLESGRKIAKAVTQARVEVVDYTHMSRMYGSVHCSTQVLMREHKASTMSNLTEKLLNTSMESITDIYPTIRMKTQLNSSPNLQNTDFIMMTPPTGFFFNSETALDNSFMNSPTTSRRTIQHNALLEYAKFHQMLTNDFGIRVHLAINDRKDAPDAVYLNNWFSTHSVHPPKEKAHHLTHDLKPTVVFYPMKAESRRSERTPDSIRRLKQHYKDVVDFTYAESKEIPAFLEGTGVFVLDRANKIAYMFESPRADPNLAKVWAERLGFELYNPGPARDLKGELVYHTNVVMAIGSKVAICCLDVIEDPDRREEMREKLGKFHEIVEITKAQMHNFCGNAIELWSPKYQKPVMIMSECAYINFTKEQKAVFERNDTLIGHSNIATIEKYGGGGVRCCIAELF